MSLVPIEDLRKAANVGDQFNVDRLPQVLEGAESWLRAKLRRQLEPSPALAGDPPADSADPVVRRVVVNGSRFVRVPDARVITKVEIDGVEIPDTDYETYAHPFPEGGPITRLELLGCRRGRVAEVTGRFGFLELPAALHEAIITLAARRVYEESIGLVDSVSSDAYGSRAYVKKLPVSVSMVITDFTVPADRIGY